MSNAKYLSNKGLYHFGEFALDLDKRLLSSNGREIPITPKAFDCLVLLVSSGGRIVSREEFFESVWASASVSDNALSYTISQLRKTLSEIDPDQTYVETVPRRGFRFAVDVVCVSGDGGSAVVRTNLISKTEEIEEVWIEEIVEEFPSKQLRARTREHRRIWFLAGFATLLLISAFAVYNFFPWREKTRIDTVAVLPISSFSRDPVDEELAARITDALITQTGSIKGVRVLSMSAVRQHSDDSLSPSQIGTKLGVDAVLEGRMQIEGDRIRTTFQLISSAKDEVIWSGKFDGVRGDLLGLQSLIGDNLYLAIGRSRDPKRPEVLSTKNSKAYEEYSRGRYFFDKRSVDFNGSLQKAEEHFKAAVELDPEFSSAIAELSSTVSLLTASGVYNRNKGYPRARELALRSLVLDSSSADANTALGWVYHKYDRNFAEAEKAYKRALEQRPEHPLALSWLAINYSLQGRSSEAIVYGEKAVAVEPTSTSNIENLLAMYLRVEDCERALRMLGRLESLSGDSDQIRRTRAETLISCGKYEEGIGILETMRPVLEERGLEPARIYASLGYAYAATGQREKALEIAGILEERRRKGYAKLGLVLIYSKLNDESKAFEAIKDLVNSDDERALYLKTDPRLKSIRSDPRFEVEIAKLNL
ncbi:MAG: winged helix-turn-helix domain-containing protein [Pyrinomonadaceae bacterium]